jgi:cytochrome oxidase Cu insertion factor (SCO1/SenC/PrrC family)
MNSGLDVSNPTLIRAFRSALLYQGAIIVAIFLLLLLAYWTVVRARGRPAAAARPGPPEPGARRLLRIGFGLLWVFDGILQAQPKMVSGLPSQVIAPAASSSPRWVQDVVNAGGTIWSYHPIQAAAAAVWIQAGIGLWMIAAKEGWSSRLAGMAGVAWGLIVWVFGEAFGAIFAPALSWLTGAPGAVVIYVAAGVLIALPLGAWTGRRLGRLVLAGTGAFWVGMAVLQAWPGRGFWQGDGPLTDMTRDMAGSDQPHAQSAMVSAFTSFAAAHGFAVNLFVVLALALLGLGLLALARPGPRGPAAGRVPRLVVPAATVFCLAVWVLVQDFGVPGGLGTDPNSMVPWLLLLWAGYLAVNQREFLPERAVVPPVRSRFSAEAVRAALSPSAIRSAVARSPGAIRSGVARSPAAIRSAVASTRSVAALGAIGVVLVGAAPMAAASASQNADPIIARAVAGASVPANLPAPDFRLVSQSGRVVSLASLRGRAVLLTFFDPVCGECRTIASELKLADGLLGGKDVELVAITAGSVHTGPGFVRAFNRQAGMATVPNWLFLTGTVAQLEQVWTRYERVAPRMMSGMNARSDFTFVIDKAGRIRQEIRNNPGPGTTSTRSSFAVLMSDAVRQAAD